MHRGAQKTNVISAGLHIGTVIITGGTSGLGLEAARDIANTFPSATIILASRSGESVAQQLAQELQNSNIHYMKLDLSSLQQVREFVEHLRDTGYPPVTHLLLNAGLQITSGGLQKTVDGFEGKQSPCTPPHMHPTPPRTIHRHAMQAITHYTPQLTNHTVTFAVNHLGHFLLFQLLRPLLSPTARITVVASGVHDPVQSAGMPGM